MKCFDVVSRLSLAIGARGAMTKAYGYLTAYTLRCEVRCVPGLRGRVLGAVRIPATAARAPTVGSTRGGSA
jgi:hypothetical protein